MRVLRRLHPSHPVKQTPTQLQRRLGRSPNSKAVGGLGVFLQIAENFGALTKKAICEIDGSVLGGLQFRVLVLVPFLRAVGGAG